jgi:hypothetical protein
MSPTPSAPLRASSTWNLTHHFRSRAVPSWTLIGLALSPQEGDSLVGLCSKSPRCQSIAKWGVRCDAPVWSAPPNVCAMRRADPRFPSTDCARVAGSRAEQRSKTPFSSSMCQFSRRAVLPVHDVSPTFPIEPSATFGKNEPVVE